MLYAKAADNYNNIVEKSNPDENVWTLLTPDLHTMSGKEVISKAEYVVSLKTRGAQKRAVKYLQQTIMIWLEKVVNEIPIKNNEPDQDAFPTFLKLVLDKVIKCDNYYEVMQIVLNNPITAGVFLHWLQKTHLYIKPRKISAIAVLYYGFPDNFMGSIVQDEARLLLDKLSRQIDKTPVDRLGFPILDSLPPKCWKLIKSALKKDFRIIYDAAAIAGSDNTGKIIHALLYQHGYNIPVIPPITYRFLERPDLDLVNLEYCRCFNGSVEYHCERYQTPALKRFDGTWLIGGTTSDGNTLRFYQKTESNQPVYQVDDFVDYLQKQPTVRHFDDENYWEVAEEINVWFDHYTSHIPRDFTYALCLEKIPSRFFKMLRTALLQHNDEFLQMLLNDGFTDISNATYTYLHTRKLTSMTPTYSFVSELLKELAIKELIASDYSPDDAKRLVNKAADCSDYETSVADLVSRATHFVLQEELFKQHCLAKDSAQGN